MLFFSPAPGGRIFAKDPSAVRFHGAVYLYYSTLVTGSEQDGWQIGIARSEDLETWTRCGTLRAEQPAEGRGICAPGAVVIGGRVHLFYQSYGQFPRDYICHAVSEDGVHFVRDASNPVIRPTGEWNNGRAIDADAAVMGDQVFLYWATRDPKGEIQQLGVSCADVSSDLSRDRWRQMCDAPILSPILPWEQMCIEAPAAVALDGRMYLFYAGAYNCSPQQIGCAVSEDGVHFTRLSEQPLLQNGPEGAWNASESGHPGILADEDGSLHLFYQGSPDKGRTWLLSRARVRMEGGRPVIEPTIR